MTTVKDLLVAARALIADEANWTTLVSARNSIGDQVCSTDPTAVCFCAVGAVNRAANVSVYWIDNTAHKAVNQLRERAKTLHGQFEFDGQAIEAVNDLLGHAAVLRVYDAAIERA